MTDKWKVFIQDECTWSEKAVKLLESNKEKDITVINITNSTGHKIKMIELGLNYTPVIYKNETNLIGSYGDLVQYFQKTWF